MFIFYSTVLINGGFIEEDRIENVICLVTSNALIKTRKFFRNFDRGYPLTVFTGPGKQATSNQDPMHKLLHTIVWEIFVLKPFRVKYFFRGVKFSLSGPSTKFITGITSPQ